MEGKSTHVVGMAYESANGDLDSALDSILGNVPDGSAQVVPNDVQVNGLVNNIGPDAARSVYESLELEDATGAEIAGADEEQDDNDIDAVANSGDAGESNLSYDYGDDELIDMAIDGIDK